MKMLRRYGPILACLSFGGRPHRSTVRARYTSIGHQFAQTFLGTGAAPADEPASPTREGRNDSRSGFASLNLPANLSGFVLACIEADFCKDILSNQFEFISKHVSKSTIFAHFCTASSSTFGEIKRRFHKLKRNSSSQLSYPERIIANFKS